MTISLLQEKWRINASLWPQQGHLHAFNSTHKWTALLEGKFCSKFLDIYKHFSIVRASADEDFCNMKILYDYVSSHKACCHEGINHSPRSSSQWNLPSDCVTSPPGKGSLLTNYYNAVWQPARIVTAVRNLDVFWLFFHLFVHLSPGKFEIL
jgi:hypothetical protein